MACQHPNLKSLFLLKQIIELAHHDPIIKRRLRTYENNMDFNILFHIHNTITLLYKNQCNLQVSQVKTCVFNE